MATNALHALWAEPRPTNAPDRRPRDWALVAAPICWSWWKTRFVARFTRTGSVMESSTIRTGIATDASIMVNNVGLMSNSKTTPARRLSMSPGLYRAK
jgi:hypothetical protein